MAVVYERRTVAIRKERPCSECRSWIAKGESATTCKGLWPELGGWATFTRCARCVDLEYAMMDAVHQVSDLVLPLGELWQCALEEWSEWPPDDGKKMAIGRKLVDMRRRMRQ